MLTLAEKIMNKLKEYIKTEEAAPVVTANGHEFLEKLTELAKLKREGLLTDEEFAAAKAKLLS